MKIAATMRILFMLIMASCFSDQHGSHLSVSVFTPHEMTSLPADAGNFSSQELVDVQHGDDITSELPLTLCSPEFTLPEVLALLVPSPALTIPSSCWQPPEFCA